LRIAWVYTVQEIIAKLPDEQWKTITWREGSRGAMSKQFVAVRMLWAIGTSACTLEDRRVYTGAEGWLIGEKPLPDELTYGLLGPPTKFTTLSPHTVIL